MNTAFVQTRMATQQGWVGLCLRWARKLGVVASALLLSGPDAARADDVAPIEPRALAIMKQMSEYTQRQQSFRITVDTTIDEMDDGQLIQASHIKTITLQRPDKLRVVSKGDGQHRQIWFDGQTLTMCDIDHKVHAKREIPGSINEMMDRYETKCGHTMPMADILRADINTAMMANVLAGRYVGLHYVGKRPCHHLAFKQQEVDWQIWIAYGDQPLTHKLVITYKLEPGAPQFTAVITSWELAPVLGPDAFSATIPDESEPIVIYPTPEAEGAQAPREAK